MDGWWCFTLNEKRGYKDRSQRMNDRKREGGPGKKKSPLHLHVTPGITLVMTVCVREKSQSIPLLFFYKTKSMWLKWLMERWLRDGKRMKFNNSFRQKSTRVKTTHMRRIQFVSQEFWSFFRGLPSLFSSSQVYLKHTPRISHEWIDEWRCPKEGWSSRGRGCYRRRKEDRGGVNETSIPFISKARRSKEEVYVSRIETLETSVSFISFLSLEPSLYAIS